MIGKRIESKVWKFICEVFSRIWDMGSLRICIGDRLVMLWFYAHCVIAVVILIADAKGTVEPAVNRFEEKIGIYTVPDTTKIDDEQLKDLYLNAQRINNGH